MWLLSMASDAPHDASDVSSRVRGLDRRRGDIHAALGFGPKCRCSVTIHHPRSKLKPTFQVNRQRFLRILSMFFWDGRMDMTVVHRIVQNDVTC